MVVELNRSRRGTMVDEELELDLDVLRNDFGGFEGLEALLTWRGFELDWNWRSL